MEVSLLTRPHYNMLFRLPYCRPTSIPSAEGKKFPPSNRARAVFAAFPKGKILHFVRKLVAVFIFLTPARPYLNHMSHKLYFAFVWS